MVEYELLGTMLGVIFFAVGLFLFCTQIPSHALFFVGGILMLSSLLLLTPILRSVLS